MSKQCWPKKPIRNRKGVYLLYNKDEIVYVGKSHKCMANRLTDHQRSNKVFTKVHAFIIENDANLAVAEIYLIGKYKPKYNEESMTTDELTIHIDNLDKIIHEEVILRPY